MMRRIAVAVPLAISLALATTTSPVAAAPSAVSSSLVTAKDDNPGQGKGQDKQKPKPAKAKPAKAGSKGGNPPAHSNGKGRDQAPGQIKKSSGSTAGGGASNADPRSENENEKITYCHVPPGNPANGHAITTSVNAIDPGHLNHSGDVIPPYEYVKQGETVTFGGQNWGPDAQAYIDAGCTTTGSTTSGASTAPVDPATTGVDESAKPEVAGRSVVEAADRAPGGLVDGILPDAGGARLGLLLVALALVAGGVALVLRRRGTA